MREVIELFNKLKKTSSTNDKKAIIKANSDNYMFKKCLVFLLDSNIVTGISDAKLKKVGKVNAYYKAKVDFKNFEEVMEYLKRIIQVEMKILQM